MLRSDGVDVVYATNGGGSCFDSQRLAVRSKT